jgi:hypothetical protein
MSRDDDTSSGQVKTAIPLMRGGMSQKHAGNGARCKFVGCRGRHVGVAEVAKHDVQILRRLAMEETIWNIIMNGGAWAPIKEVGGGGEGFSPIGGSHVGVDVTP